MFKRSISHLSSFTVAGAPVHGFSCVEKHEMPDLNMTGYKFLHDKTHAQYYHFDAADDSHAFCMGLRTPPTNGRGAAPVLKHMAFCGSRKYPIPRHMEGDTLFSLTETIEDDCTLFSFSTTSTKDFPGLIDEYLDTILHPLLRVEDFEQQTHRLRMNGDETETGEMLLDGVVYRKMKEDISDPRLFFGRLQCAKCLPGIHYQHICAGYLPTILDLTHEEVKMYHVRHYHPSNSIAMTYGSSDPLPAMAVMNDYFSAFERQEPVKVPRLEKFHTSKTIIDTTGPMDFEQDAKTQCRVSCCAAIPPELDTAANHTRLVTLSALLQTDASSPLYKALISSGVGTGYTPMCGYTPLSTPTMAFGVEGVSERPRVDREVEDIIEKTLRTVMKEGFDQGHVDAVVSQQLSEVEHKHTTYGTNLLTHLTSLALTNNQRDALGLANIVPQLKQIAAAPSKELLPVLSKAFLDNPHRLRLMVTPSQRFLANVTDNVAAKERTVAAEKKKNWLSRISLEGHKEPHPIEVGPRIYYLRCSSELSWGYIHVHSLIPLTQAEADALMKDELTQDDITAQVRLPLLHRLLLVTTGSDEYYDDLMNEIENHVSFFCFRHLQQFTSDSCNIYTVGLRFTFLARPDAIEGIMSILRRIMGEPRTKNIENLVAKEIERYAKNLPQSVEKKHKNIAMWSAASSLNRASFLMDQYRGVPQIEYSWDLWKKSDCIDEVTSAYRSFTETLPSRAKHTLLWFTCDDGCAARVVKAMTAFKRSFESASLDIAPDKIQFPMAPPLKENLVITRHLRYGDNVAASVIPYSFPHSSPTTAFTELGCALLNLYHLKPLTKEKGEGRVSAVCELSEAEGAVFISTGDLHQHKLPGHEELFGSCAEWLRDGSNITEERLEATKKAISHHCAFRSCVDFYGMQPFLVGLTDEKRVEIRHTYLNATREDIIATADYWDIKKHHFSKALLSSCYKKEE